MTTGSTEKSQHCSKYILQYSIYASERPQVRIWGRQTCFLLLAPCNLVTPLDEIVEWLLNICPEIQCGLTVVMKKWLKRSTAVYKQRKSAMSIFRYILFLRYFLVDDTMISVRISTRAGRNCSGHLYKNICRIVVSSFVGSIFVQNEIIYGCR